MCVTDGDYKGHLFTLADIEAQAGSLEGLVFQQGDKIVGVLGGEFCDQDKLEEVEQICATMLSSRWDLFSFALVVHEKCTDKNIRQVAAKARRDVDTIRDYGKGAKLYLHMSKKYPETVTLRFSLDLSFWTTLGRFYHNEDLTLEQCREYIQEAIDDPKMTVEKFRTLMPTKNGVPDTLKPYYKLADRLDKLLIAPAAYPHLRKLAEPLVKALRDLK